VILITQSLARQFFPNEDPLGKHISLELIDRDLELPKTEREVVGIVGDAKLGSIESDHQMSAVYVPMEQVPDGYSTLVVRTANDPASSVSGVTAAVHSVDASLALMDIASMDQVVASAVAQRRFNMLLLVAFGGVALILAAVGIYSVLSYSVRRRVREIGIRMALGAQVRDVVRMVMIDGLKPTVFGVAIGFVGALSLGRVMASVIYGVSARDAMTFAAVSLLLLGVAVTASVLPAYRAAQVEPVATLREE
jgi:ABC-type antimicrobial peptide transport system permease subunit